jgi:hypothetical protein
VRLHYLEEVARAFPQKARSIRGGRIAWFNVFFFKIQGEKAHASLGAAEEEKLMQCHERGGEKFPSTKDR